MKRLLKKIFCRDDPARELVFALALLFFGSWCVWTCTAMLGEFSPVLTGFMLWAESWDRGARLIYSANFVLPLVFLLFFAVQLVRTVRVRRRDIPGLWKIGLALLPPAALFLAGLFTTAAMLISWDVFDTRAENICLFSEQPPTLLIYAGAAAVLPMFLLAGKAAAAGTGIPFRKVFGRGTVIISFLFAGLYLFSAASAVSASRETEKSVAEAEKFFSSPLTAEALGRAFYRGEKPDGKFWLEIEKLKTEAEKEAGPDRFRKITDWELKVLPEKEMQTFRDFLTRSRALEEWEARFARPLPPAERDYRPGGIAGMRLPEYALCRDFCRLQLAKIRLAVLDKDRSRALEALHRMDPVRDYLGRGHTLLPGLVLAGCEECRLAGLENLLEARLLTEDDLKRERESLDRSVAELQRVHRQSIYGEAVLALDACEMAAHGSRISPRQYLPGLYPLRWLLPAAWETMTRNRKSLIAYFLIDDLTKAVPPEGMPARENKLARLLIPALARAGKRFRKLETRCRFLRAQMTPAPK